MTDDVAIRGAKGIQSIEVGYQILEALEAAPGPVALKQLAANAGMSASKARFYLNSLMRCGLVTQAGPGGVYDLGPAALRLGLAALAHLDVMRVARIALWDLVNETGATAFISVWGNRGATIVHRVEGRHGSPLEVRLGTVLEPLSATSRALLASFTPIDARRLLENLIANARPHDPLRGQSLEHVLEQLDEVRRTGAAQGSGASAPRSGFRGIAAAVVDHTGTGCVAITISSGDEAAEDPTSESLSAALRRVVEEISEQIGGGARPATSSLRGT